MSSLIVRVNKEHFLASYVTFTSFLSRTSWMIFSTALQLNFSAGSMRYVGSLSWIRPAEELLFVLLLPRIDDIRFANLRDNITPAKDSFGFTTGTVFVVVSATLSVASDGAATLPPPAFWAAIAKDNRFIILSTFTLFIHHTKYDERYHKAVRLLYRCCVSSVTRLRLVIHGFVEQLTSWSPEHLNTCDFNDWIRTVYWFLSRFLSSIETQTAYRLDISRYICFRSNLRPVKCKLLCFHYSLQSPDVVPLWHLIKTLTRLFCFSKVICT